MNCRRPFIVHPSSFIVGALCVSVVNRPLLRELRVGSLRERAGEGRSQ
jgi:hypothetical protein